MKNVLNFWGWFIWGMCGATSGKGTKSITYLNKVQNINTKQTGCIAACITVKNVIYQGEKKESVWISRKSTSLMSVLLPVWEEWVSTRWHCVTHNLEPGGTTVK